MRHRFGAGADWIQKNQMAVEIERKFLVASDQWKKSVTGSVHIRDGLVAYDHGKKVRVRIADGRATLTLKGYRAGLTRGEFEYPIPLSDAEDIISTMCDGQTLEKRRHFLLFEGTRWEVDVYEGLLAGVVIAEVEMTTATQAVAIPGWVGQEVTGDPKYRKVNMHDARLADLQAAEA
jgi:adenylate cyclase